MEGIFAALDSLPDDCVEYSVFLAGDASAAVSDLDRKRARLEQIRDDALDLARPWTKDYIWQRQPFTLRLLELSDVPCLRGVTEFGDCIDDEWFIVFILRELSRRHPDLYIRIVDNDGEFLLIEAADALPRWINPDNADNRVWIINGELNIIPPVADDDDDSISSLNLTDALHFLNTSKSTLFHPKALQNAAFSRLSVYPSAAKSHIHRARVTVPRRVAQILHLNKSYIAPACEAFMLRDPISMRACASMKNFPTSDSVTVTVQFTRLLYAQMKAQRIVPPAPFKLPEPSNPAYDAAELGMKLACGFELLCAGSGKSTKNKKRRSDLASDQRFNTYLSQLKREGFFDSAKPNSPKYDVLMREAQKTYLSICGDEYVPLEIGKEIISMVESMPPATDEDIRQWDHGQIEDSDSWLDVDFDDFVKTMDSLNGSALENNETAEREEFEQLQGKAKDLFQKLNTFVGDKESGLDGVTFDNDDISDGSSIEDDSEEEPEDDVDEDEFLEFFLKEALKLSPEEIEQFRADPIPDATPSNPKKKQKQKQKAKAKSKARSAPQQPSEEEDDDDDDPISYMPSAAADPQEQAEVLKNLIASMQSQEGGAGPATNLLSRLFSELGGLDVDGSSSSSSASKSRRS